jgi:hypothetical protein
LGWPPRKLALTFAPVSRAMLIRNARHDDHRIETLQGGWIDPAPPEKVVKLVIWFPTLSASDTLQNEVCS